MIVRRRGLFLLASIAAIAVLLLTVVLFYLWPEARAGYRADAGPPATLSELGWDLVADGDFQERSVEPAGDRLRVRASIGKTRRDTAKFVGARRREEIRLTPGARITVELDWNRPPDSTGLSAGFVLAPDITTGNPLAMPSGIWVEYKGVPPGKKARRMIGMREGGRHHHLDSDGWPQRSEGRDIDVQKFDLEVLEDGAFRVFEDDKLIYTSVPKTLRFDRGYLYLMLLTSHSAAPREVFFGKLGVTPGR
jgi:hypothetical protein